MATHEVEAGECLVTIAHHYGFNWKVLWAHPDNEALRQKRKSPNVLFPGDLIAIPEKKPKTWSVATEKRHEFTIKRTAALLRLRLVEGGEILKDEPYKLQVGSETWEGKTDGSGKLEHPVPAHEQEAALVLTKRRLGFTLKIGHLDPAEEIEGMQARLRCLGFYEGAVDGEFGPLTESAVEAFQAERGLSVSGELDEATADELTKAFGC